MNTGNQRVICFAVLFLIGIYGFAQNDFFFNHYMFNPSYFNPAWIGTENEAFAAMHHRSQWAGYDASFDPQGAPSTQLLSVVVPMESLFSGVGLSVVNDRSGPLTSLQVRGSLSISKRFSFGSLSLGIMPAFNVASLNANYRFVDQGDDAIPAGNESQLQPNLHAGLYYVGRSNELIGFSMQNMLNPNFDFGAEATNEIATEYTLITGTSLGLIRGLVLKPTVMIRSDLNTFTYDISAIAVYQERMWGGLAFRRGESISLMMGYSFLENNKLKAGYSFDYIVKDQDAKQPTSHEVFIRYDLPSLIFGGRKAVKTPRFTF